MTMDTNIFSIVGIAIITTALAVLLRQFRPEYALFVSLAGGIFILLLACTGILPVVEQIYGMLEASSVPGEYGSVLFRALGICFVTQIACDTCKDAGESAIASKLELAGKVVVLAISLPLFQQVLSIVYSLMV